jgi:hypothetical protein
MHDAYEYNKNVRPTFPYESQWEEFKGLQRVRFWIWVILFLLSLTSFSLLLWRTFYNEVGNEFAVGFISGPILVGVMGAVLKLVVGRVGKRR